MRIFLFICFTLCGPLSLVGQDVEKLDTPNWAEDIAPILYANCVECHRPNQVAPFSLLDYEDAAKRARFIARATEERFMPPWNPTAPKGAFLGEKGLSSAEIELIERWAKTGASKGDLLKAPARPEFPSAKWTLGQPDLVVKMPRAYTLPAQSEDEYRVFPIPFSLDRVPKEVFDKARIDGPEGPESDFLAVAAVDIIAGNRRILHHADVWVDTSGAAVERERKGGEVGFTSFGTPGFDPAGYLGGRLPGFKASFLPNGIAKAFLPINGADLALQVHYSPTGKVETDRSEIGIYFMREPVKRLMESIFLRSFNIDIPPGESNYVVRDELVVPADCFLLNIFPHMHLLGKSVYAKAILPDGRSIPLIEVDTWRFNWQDFYVYKEPITLPKGTRIKCVWTFDNSDGNPSNPHDPPERVQFGPNSADEMCELHLGVIPLDLEDWPLLPAAREAKLKEKIDELSPEQKARFDWSSAGLRQ